MTYYDEADYERVAHVIRAGAEGTDGIARALGVPEDDGLLGLLTDMAIAGWFERVGDKLMLRDQSRPVASAEVRRQIVASVAYGAVDPEAIAAAMGRANDPSFTLIVAQVLREDVVEKAAGR